MAAPLALDVAPHGELPGWRRGEEALDSLAYIDNFTEQEKAMVERLIIDELKNSTKRPQEYLKEMAPMPNFRLEGHPVLKAELERVRSGLPMAGLDIARYRLDEPSLNRRNDIAAWRSALDNAHSQLEHQYNRLLNLELLLQFGPRAWQAHIRHLEVAHQGYAALLLAKTLVKHEVSSEWQHNTSRLESQLAEAQKAVEVVNRERKLSQTEVQRELSGYQAQYRATLEKNAEIEAACAEVERELQAVVAELPKIEDKPKDIFGIREGTGADANGRPEEFGLDSSATEMDLN